jgi:hypothetical protein
MNFNRMSQGMHRLKEIAENVESDQLNIEKYVKELTTVVREMFLSTGSMFQQENVRVFSMIAATGGGGYGGGHGGGASTRRPSWSTRSSNTFGQSTETSRSSDNGTKNSPQRLDKSQELMRR